jgi:hypothetical protein
MKKTAAIALLLPLCACAVTVTSSTQTQTAATQFDQAAHSVDTLQIAYDKSIQANECRAWVYDQAYAYATSKTAPINLAATCQPVSITDQQIANRQALMDAISLYADDLAAIATAGDDTALAANNQTLATKINAAMKAGGFTNMQVAACVESAISGLTDMALDHTKQTDIRAAAAAQQDNLATVVGVLETENTSLASSFPSNAGDIRAKFAAALAYTRKSEGPAVFFSVIQANDILESFPAEAGTAATALNAALEGLLKANQALATADDPGLMADISDLVARVQTAQAMQAAVAK